MRLSFPPASVNRIGTANLNSDARRLIKSLGSRVPSSTSDHLASICILENLNLIGEYNLAKELYEHFAVRTEAIYGLETLATHRERLLAVRQVAESRGDQSTVVDAASSLYDLDRRRDAIISGILSPAAPDAA